MSKTPGKNNIFYIPAVVVPGKVRYFSYEAACSAARHDGTYVTDEDGLVIVDFTPKDRSNTICEQCGGGEYIETSVYDDWDGVLHCSNCGHEVRRWTDR